MQVTLQEAVIVAKFLRRCSTLGQHQPQVSDDGSRMIWRNHSCESVDQCEPLVLAMCGAVAGESMSET